METPTTPPAVSPSTWIWWADGPCDKDTAPVDPDTGVQKESEKECDLLILPPPNYGVSIQSTVLREDILTSIRPADVASMSPSSKSLWELKNVFNHIYTTIQTVMRLWVDPCWRPVIDACFWSTIEASGGDPRVSYKSCRNDVYITQAYDTITNKFGEPRYLLITCAQWQKYTALTNSLSRIQATVREYEYMRGRMAEPADYIRIHMTELFPSIDRDRYFVNQPECFDYDRFFTPVATFPWPA